MASLNYHGGLLASKPIPTNEDEYDSDDLNDEKFSFL
jgi:hypothetical protein